MFENNNYEIFQGDALEVLKTLDDNSINCCVTSPPYYGLRDYGTGKWVGGDPDCPHYRTTKISDATITGHAKMAEVGEAVGDAIYKSVCPLCGAVREDKQIGLEETPEEYIQRLVDVFHEVKRVLKDDGTLWVNIGDSYNQSTRQYEDRIFSEKSIIQKNNKGTYNGYVDRNLYDGCKQKDLIGIPWMLAFALRADGWYLRQDIIWHKPNPMPESVKDRCTKSHEYIFLLSKSPSYYFDYNAIKEDAVTAPHKAGNLLHPDKISGPNDRGGHSQWEENMDSIWGADGMKNKRDVWTVRVSSFKDAHFATFPEELIEPCILAGSPVGGVVLDVFNGSATTGLVSLKNNRKYIGIELNEKFIDMSRKRLNGVCGITEVVNAEGNVVTVKKVGLF